MVARRDMERGPPTEPEPLQPVDTLDFQCLVYTIILQLQGTVRKNSVIAPQKQKPLCFWGCYLRSFLHTKLFARHSAYHFNPMFESHDRLNLRQAFQRDVDEFFRRPIDIAENLRHIARTGRFVTVMPRTHGEDEKFRTRLRQSPQAIRWEPLYDKTDEQGEVTDRLFVCADEWLSSAG